MTEFPHDSVPIDSRRHAAQIGIVALGLTCVAINMIVGGDIARGTTTTDWWIALLLGGAIVAAIAVSTADHSARTGKSFSQQLIEVFGVHGSRVVALAVGSVILGWYTIQASLLGHVFAVLVGVDGTTTEYLAIGAAPILLASTAYIGFRGLAWHSVLSVPAILILCVLGLLVGRNENATSPFAEASALPLFTGVDIVIGLWILGATATIGDIARFARSPRQARWCALFAFLIGNTGLMLVGGLALAMTGKADISDALVFAGYALLGFVLLLANIWSTNDSAMYSVALNWSRVVPLGLRPLIGIGAVIATAVALTQPYESGALLGWLLLLSRAVPVLAGILVANRLLQRMDAQRLLSPLGATAILAICATLALVVPTFPGISIASLIAAGLAYVGLSLALPRRSIR